MSLRTLATTVAVLAALGATLTAPGAVAAQPDRGGQTAFFDMYANPTVAPKRIFLTASSGPWLKGLAWDDWGTAKAVATGKYVSDCASCSPPGRRDATVTFTQRVACHGEGEGYFAYKRGVVHLSAPDEGHTRTTFKLPMGCP